MPPLNKCRIRKAKNLINAAAFNQLNTVSTVFLHLFLVIFIVTSDMYLYLMNKDLLLLL